MKRTQKKMALTICSACFVLALFGVMGCSPSNKADAPQGESNSEPTTTASFAWTPDSDCSTCHSTESQSMTDSACLASTHEKAGNTCTTCHADEAGLTKAHEGATADGAKKATKLRSTTVDEKTCLSSSCHVSYDDLAAKTADSTALVDINGTTVNPHAMPDNPDHEKTTCASCHVMHTDEPVTDSAPDYCISCHHAKVYECNTCH